MLSHNDAPLAQRMRASGYEPEGRRFDPSRGHHSTRHGVLAQLEERLLCKQGVAGSSPADSTNIDGCPRGQRALPGKQMVGASRHVSSNLTSSATLEVWLSQVEGARLESGRAASLLRGFESHSFRQNEKANGFPLTLARS